MYVCMFVCMNVCMYIWMYKSCTLLTWTSYFLLLCFYFTLHILETAKQLGCMHTCLYYGLLLKAISSGKIKYVQCNTNGITSLGIHGFSRIFQCSDVSSSCKQPSWQNRIQLDSSVNSENDEGEAPLVSQPRWLANIHVISFLSLQNLKYLEAYLRFISLGCITSPSYELSFLNLTEH